MKNLLYILLVLCCISCTKTILDTTTIQSEYIKSEYYQVNKQGFDSICAIDTIPNNVEAWYYSGWIDEETHKPIELYLYVKDYNIPKPITYILSIDSTEVRPYILEIRKIYNIEK